MKFLHKAKNHKPHNMHSSRGKLSAKGKQRQSTIWNQIQLQCNECKLQGFAITSVNGSSALLEYV